ILTAGIDQMVTGWVRWQDYRPVEQIMMTVAMNQFPPLRRELGDTDPTKWEVDAKGERRDPWQFTSYVPMVGQDGALYTFTAGSKGSHGAVGKLARVYARHRRNAPDDLPLIALDVDSYQHKIREYGRISVPVFTVIGWEHRERFIKAMKEAGYDAPESAPAP